MDTITVVVLCALGVAMLALASRYRSARRLQRSSKPTSEDHPAGGAPRA